MTDPSPSRLSTVGVSSGRAGRSAADRAGALERSLRSGSAALLLLALAQLLILLLGRAFGDWLAAFATAVGVAAALIAALVFFRRSWIWQARAAGQASGADETAVPDAGASREAEIAASSPRSDDVASRFGAFRSELATLVDQLQGTAAVLLGDADQLSAAAAKTAAQVITVSVASEDTARRTESAACAIQDLARTINEVGANSARSSDLAASAAQEADRSNAIMTDLSAVAREIGKVTDLISGIARQTNLLALNAMIEAARSGQAGRGFVVVADEVKALANQTAQATQDIGARTASMQKSADRSVATLEAISTRIRELDRRVAEITAAVEEQARATAGIAGDVASAAAGVAHVEKSISTIESLADATTRAIAAMGGDLQHFANQVSAIKNRLSAFDADVERMCA